MYTYGHVTVTASIHRNLGGIHPTETVILGISSQLWMIRPRKWEPPWESQCHKATIWGWFIGEKNTL